MKAVVSLSGGMDSATVLALAIQEHGADHVHAVGFTYGSKHNKYENSMAVRLTEHYRIPFRLIHLQQAMRGIQSNLMMSGGDIPEGHYEAKSMEQTVVPGRNMIFISILAGVAWTLEAQSVWIGIHAGDHAIYPDCRPHFFHSMNDAVVHGTDGRVSLRAPFLKTDKFGILRQGYMLDVPYQLTRTCYKDQEVACGKCGSCQERLTAFAKLGIKDPLEYESRELLPKTN